MERKSLPDDSQKLEVRMAYFNEDAPLTVEFNLPLLSKYLTEEVGLDGSLVANTTYILPRWDLNLGRYSLRVPEEYPYADKEEAHDLGNILVFTYDKNDPHIEIRIGQEAIENYEQQKQTLMEYAALGGARNPAKVQRREDIKPLWPVEVEELRNLRYEQAQKFIEEFLAKQFQRDLLSDVIISSVIIGEMVDVNQLQRHMKGWERWYGTLNSLGRSFLISTVVALGINRDFSEKEAFGFVLANGAAWLTGGFVGQRKENYERALKRKKESMSAKYGHFMGSTPYGRGLYERGWEDMVKVTPKPKGLDTA